MRLLLILAAYAALTVALNAQTAERTGPTSSQNVIAQPVAPAPENGNITVYFGDTVQIYFKRPFKSLKLDDPYVVRAEPHSDHIIAFTGLAPGTTKLTIEDKDNANSSVWGLVTTVRQHHEVKIYTPPPSPEAKAVANRGGTVIFNEAQKTGAEDEKADYKSILCNEAECRQPPKER